MSPRVIFANKLEHIEIYNYRTFIDEGKSVQAAENAMLRDEDKWIISHVNEATADIINSLEKFELGLQVRFMNSH